MASHFVVVTGREASVMLPKIREIPGKGGEKKPSTPTPKTDEDENNHRPHKDANSKGR